MDLTRLHHFVAVAEELHFRRAAARLGMSQPPLSLSIKRLEESLGVRLFERTRWRVNLTPAGQALLTEARQILNHATLAERVTKRAASGSLSQLRIGTIPGTLVKVLPRAIKAFRGKWPGVHIHLFEHSPQAYLKGLHEGKLDLAVFTLHTVDPAGLAVRTIERSRFVAAVPFNSPLAKRKNIKLAELADFPFVMFPAKVDPHFYASVTAACNEANFVPNLVQEVGHIFTMLNMIANDVGVSLLTESTTLCDVGRVSFVPIIDLPEYCYTETAIAWVPHAASPLLKAFISALESVIER